MNKTIFNFALLALLLALKGAASTSSDTEAPINLSDGAAESFCILQKCRDCEALKNKGIKDAQKFYSENTTKMDERLREFILREDRLEGFTLSEPKLTEKAKSIAKEFHDVKVYYPFPSKDKKAQLNIDKVNKVHKENLSFFDYCYGKAEAMEALKTAVLNVNKGCNELKAAGTVADYDAKNKVAENVRNFLITHDVIKELNKIDPKDPNGQKTLLVTFALKANQLWVDVAYYLGFKTTSERVCFGKDVAKEAMYKIMSDSFLSILAPQIQALSQAHPAVTTPPASEMQPPSTATQPTPTKAPAKTPAVKPLPQVQTPVTFEQQLKNAIEESWKKRRAQDPPPADK